MKRISENPYKSDYEYAFRTNKLQRAFDAGAQAQLDQDKQEVIYWRGLLDSVMCEIYADGLTEKTKKKVMAALEEKK